MVNITVLIEFPLLALDTTKAQHGLCAWVDGLDVDFEILEVADSAVDMVVVLRDLCGNKRPKSILFVNDLANNPVSYTGLRIGWCVARGIAEVWGAKIWTGQEPLNSKEKLLDLIKNPSEDNSLELTYKDRKVATCNEKR